MRYARSFVSSDACRYDLGLFGSTSSILEQATTPANSTSTRAATTKPATESGALTCNAHTGGVHDWYSNLDCSWTYY